MHTNRKPVSEEFHFLAGSMCALLRVIEEDQSLGRLLERVNWKDVGVERGWLSGWWDRNRRDDEKRRAFEAREREQARVAARARGKLTPEEIEAIKNT